MVTCSQVETAKVEVVKVVPPSVGQNRRPEVVARSGAVVGGVVPGRIIVAARDGHPFELHFGTFEQVADDLLADASLAQAKDLLRA